MPTLKEEYNAKKRLDEMKKLIEFKYTFDENFILVEAIDVQKLDQMASAVSKLDAVLNSAGVAQKVPTLKRALDAATSEMQKFVAQPAIISSIIGKMGKLNPITKSMTLFSALSKFFKDQMPKIIKAYKIDQAATNFNKLANSEDPQALPEQEEQDYGGNLPLSKQPYLRDSLKKIENIFQSGLRPSGVLGFFGLSNLPYMDAKQVAREMLELTPSELMQLTKNIESIQIPITAADKNDLMQLAKGVMPQALNQTIRKAGGAPPAENDANTAVAQLGQMPPDQIGKLIQGVKSVPELLQRINAHLRQGQPAQLSEEDKEIPTDDTPDAGSSGGNSGLPQVPAVDASPQAPSIMLPSPVSLTAKKVGR
jgi:hypothetical protein